MESADPSLSGQRPGAIDDGRPLAMHEADAGLEEAAGAEPPASPASSRTSLADGARRKLHPDHMLVGRLGGWIRAAILSGLLMSGAVPVIAFTGLPLPIKIVLITMVLGLIGLMAWSAHFWPAISYRHCWYSLDATALEIGRGVIWRQHLTVPRSRVQHMDVNQGPVERRFDLAHLVVHTAGTANASVVLDGLDHGTAVALRDHLLSSGDGSGDAV